MRTNFKFKINIMSKIREVELSKRNGISPKRNTTNRTKKKKGFLSSFFDYFLFLSIFD